MKNILYVFILISLSSCTNKQIAARLVQADSLMSSRLDSAYAILKSINPDDVRGAEQNAYYALLLTQAQYKNYDTIKSDSLIDIAVDYYTDNFDQDRLTRALMYKGGVLADLHYNKLALECYKQAQQIADTTDYMTSGLLNFRLGELYQNSYIENEEHIQRYKKAYTYFKKANHIQSQSNALLHIGQLYIITNTDSAQVYINQAIELSKQLDNKQYFFEGLMMLVTLYDYQNKDLQKAKNIALMVYSNRDSINVDNELFDYLATLYAKTGNIDSALYYTKQLPTPNSAVDTMRYHMILEEIAKTQNDYKSAYNHYTIAERIADSLVKASKSEQYYSIDKQFDNQVIKTQKAQLERSNYIKTFVIVVAILLSLLIGTLWFFYSKHKKNILNQKEQFIDNLQANVKHVLSTLDQGRQTENRLKDIIEKRILVLKELLSIKYQYGNTPDVFFNKFEQVISVNQKSKADCDHIIDMANELYCNVISHIEQSHSDLKYKEKLLLSLVCLKFSPIEMSIFLNLNSMTAVYNLRSRLMKKVGVTSLEEYINEQTSILQTNAECAD